MAFMKGVFRKSPHELVDEFLARSGSGLTYVRGRRRVGKSFFLKQVQDRVPKSFYFVGLEDATTAHQIQRFITEWERFTGHSTPLSLYKSENLNWELVFKEITAHLKKAQNPILIVLDEIQWIASTRSGFVSLLKIAWEDWKENGKLKLILCGSSNNFFSEKAGGEFTILRGLKTFAEIWIEPFSLAQVKDYYFSEWSDQQVALVYMLVGGIPYYLEQFLDTENFIRSINKTLFTRGSIFLDEINEVLKLEFNRSGVESVKRLLSTINFTRLQHKTIVERSGLSKSSVSEYIDKLEDYKILYRQPLIRSVIASKRMPVTYFMKDFFLYTYFQLLAPIAHQIAVNKNGLIFPHKYLQSKAGYYVPGHSGGAFELLVRSVIESRSLKAPIFTKLNLTDPNYEVDSYSLPSVVQVDLTVTHRADREVRLIECKWLTEENKMSKGIVDEVVKKQINLPKGYTVSRYIVVSHLPSSGLIEYAENHSIKIISCHDLF